MTAPAPIAAESLGRLHPRALDDPAEIRALLERLCREGTSLLRAINRHSQRESARIARVEPQALLLRPHNLEGGARPQLFFSFELDGRPYFFAAPALAASGPDALRVALPAVVYQAERRDRARGPAASAAARVLLASPRRELGEGQVVDVSPGGLGLSVPRDLRLARGARLVVRFLDGERAGQRAFGEVRNAAPGAPGWRRLGLALSDHPFGARLRPERRAAILPRSRARPAPGQHAALPEPRVVDYRNRRGQRIRALLDGCGDPRGALALLVPPAWGRTKETLLPLAATVVETFRAAGEAVSVLRFDGVNKRGESHRDRECAASGDEYLHFTFSQGVDDIQASLEFLERSLQPSRTLLVTFSVASIEGRRAVASDRRGRIAGWISVVGAPDAQSLTRVISGGVDFFGGVERGVRFGLQELQGLVVDMDRAGPDAIAHGMAFLDDARRDLAAIRVPVTWIHGRHDAWMDLERVRHVLSVGDTSRRRLIEVPTGHQLRTSREALETFGLVAREAARMALGRRLEPRLPDPAALERRRRAEQARLRPAPVDLRSFWRDYLVGRDGGVGMELVTHARPYEGLMAAQVAALALRPGERVLDLGSGVGSFPLHLTAWTEAPAGLEVTEADYVLEALARARTRLAAQGAASPLRLRFVACDLDLRAGRLGVPLRSASFDAILASLLLNYLEDPDALLREAHRLLRPGGRLVLSSLRRDADISVICVDTVSELRAGRGRQAFGAEGERRLGRALQDFISDAARLLDFEERGLFHFWDAGELARRLRAAGFAEPRVAPAFGDPPQALVLAAQRA